MAFSLSVTIDAFSPVSSRGGFRTPPSTFIFASSRVTETAELCHRHRRRQLLPRKRFQFNSAVFSSADTFVDATGTTEKTRVTTSAAAAGEEQANTKENASKINGGSGEPNAPFVGLPSYKRILSFVSTTFLIWVSEPLLSLVDSATVGRFAGRSTAAGSSSDLASVVQLAALGPAVVLCDSSIYLTLFIAMATTNKLATAFAKEDKAEQIETISHVMGVSLAVGSLLLLFVMLRGEGLLASILGPDGAKIATTGAWGATRQVDKTSEVLSEALGYSRIRSLVSPLAVMGLTAQSALLCAGDTRTPALAVLLASAINCALDYLLVAKFGLGVRGAAAATAVASASANSFLVRKLYLMFNSWKSSFRSSVGNKDDAEYKFVTFPDRKSFLSLLKLAGPLFGVMAAKIFGYNSLTVRAGSFGLVALACQNILMRIFFFFATVGDALNQASQTFLPGLLVIKDRGVTETHVTAVENPARTLLKRLTVISCLSGLANCILGRLIARYAGGIFTSDANLIRLMAHISPFMGLALSLHPLTMALEGSIIAANDAMYLVGTYGLTLAVLLAQLKFACKDFLGVWHTLLLFQMLRISQFGIRVWKKTASKDTGARPNETS